MFFQPMTEYPDDKMCIGCLIGPAIDVVTAMTYNILCLDGGYMYCSTVCAWTPLEEASVSLLAERVSF